MARDSCKPSHMMSTLVCSAAGLHRLDRLTTHSPRTNTATELPKREVQSTNPTPNLRAADISVRADHRLSPCPPLTHTSETHILLSRYCSAGRVAHKTTETPFRSSSPHRGGHRGQLKNKNRTAPPFWNVPRTLLGRPQSAFVSKISSEIRNFTTLHLVGGCWPWDGAHKMVPT